MLDSPRVQSAVRKAVAAVLGFMLALVLLTALLITGFYMLVTAATLTLTPVMGESAALAVVGASCFLLLALVFYRLTRPARSLSKGAPSRSGAGSPVQMLRELIRQNPLESALAAFALGIAEEGDPRLKSLLLQGGMVLMKEAEAERAHGKEKADAPAGDRDTPVT